MIILKKALIGDFMGITFKDNSSEILKILMNNMIDALNAAGFFVVGEASKNISNNGSVQTGLMINSNEHDIDPKKGIVRIGNTRKYSIWVEKGTGIYAQDGNGRKTPWVYTDARGNTFFTRGQKPKPFIMPAAMEHREELIEMIARFLKRGLGE